MHRSVVHRIPILHFRHERIEIDPASTEPGPLSFHGFLQLGRVDFVRIVAEFDEVSELPNLDGSQFVFPLLLPGGIDGVCGERLIQRDRLLSAMDVARSATPGHGVLDVQPRERR